jgi:signal transduction histidine kinase/ActR/RegA family two-component response regulator
MRARTFSRTSRIVAAVVLGLIGLVVLAKTIAVERAHTQAIARAERDTLNATGILAEHAARTFDGVSRALDAAGELHADVASGKITDPAAIHDGLKTIQGGSPVILGIGWTDAAGNRTGSSVFRDPPPLNIGHEENFQALRDDPAAGLYIATPVRSRVVGTWIIPVSRRIEDAHGNFAGIVNAILRVDYFLEFYRAINLGPGTGVVLARRDGIVLVRAPMVEAWVGRSLTGGRMPQGAPAGVRQMASPIDGVERIFAYEKISGFPLLIAATMSRQDALAPFREVLVSSLIEGALAVAALAVGGILLVIAIRRRESAARDLAETTALLHSVFAATDQAIVVFDRDLRAVAWNDRYTEFFGPAQVGALVPGASFESMLRAMAAVGEHGTGDGEAFVAERLERARSRQPARYERARPDGTAIDINWLPLPNGFLAISHTDITHIKKTEVALRESETRAAQAHARLRDAVESLTDPFFLWDADERLVIVNSAAASGPGGEVLMPGIRLEDALMQHIRAGRFPAAAGREEEHLRERLAQIRRADGTPSEIQRADGRWLATWDHRTREGGIVSLRVDITSLKQAEVALRESEARVAEAHARLSDAFESLPNPFMLWDAEERLVLFNSAAVDLLSPESANCPPLVPGLCFAEGLERHARAGGIPAAVGREDDYIRERLEQFRRGTGERIEVQSSDGRWFAQRDRRMRDGGTVSLRTDITESKTREAELAAARKAADEASRAKSDFLSRMSHELRTPLNAVIGFSQMLQLDRMDSLTGRQRGYCRDIESGGRHLLALVNDVLDLARIESGKDRLSVERVVVADALSRVGPAMAPLAAGAGVDLQVAEPEAVPDLRADDMRLHQILLNLVSNAIKYNRKGGSVRVSAWAVPGGRVRLVVDDTGLGIPAGLQAELFEPFHRLGHEYSGIDGTGIGLSISKRLAEAMGGTLGFFSEAGKGSSFWVELPCDASASPAAAGADLGPSAVEPADYPGGFSLLYVEDNPSNMRLMEHLVSVLPDVVMLPASTPHLGLDLARAHRPDIILLDLHLPEMNGYEMLAHLKAMPETRDIPVLALSAAAMPSDIRRGLAAGFFRYLTKPIDVKEFLAAISECIPLTGADDDQPRSAAG